MSNVLSAIDFIAEPEGVQVPPVCLLVGDEHFLRRRALTELKHAVLGGEEAEFGLTEFTGDKSLEFRDVLDELSTVAMFGGDKRLVVIEDADAAFAGSASSKKTAATEDAGAEGEASGGNEQTRKNRERLEAYVAKPSPRGVLVLEFKTCATTTRLYKAVAEHGLVIQCAAIAKEWQIPGWVTDWAVRAYKVKIGKPVAEKLVEMVGTELGLLDQELSKLAQLVGPEKAITAELVDKYCGTWRVKTAWTLIDAVLSGKVGDAMQQLDRLLASGEQPVALLAQIGATLRRMAAATRLALQAGEAGGRIDVRAALLQAGVNQFYADKSAAQLKHLTRHRGKLLYRWLLDADLDLKGASPLPPRMILERLILRLALPYNQYQGE